MVSSSSLRTRYFKVLNINYYSTFPISKEDPLIINTLPNVYAIGNQKSFRTKLDYTNEEVNITRFICVPEFYKSFSIVLMDKETLEAFEFNMDFIQN